MQGGPCCPITCIYGFLIITLFQNLDHDVETNCEESPTLSNHGNASPGVLPCTSSPHKMDAKVACPLCSDWFPEHFVEVHARTCGERFVTIITLNSCIVLNIVNDSLGFHW
ncbi:hypothetical protein EYF80_068412 [Liparis tanakae]|uniref:Uncharacterized protein n=1 Tax=Liparis tanakae TaxID=230148 RepID=A0A4Z2DYI2_9TELE|nr:hypothetical protein EYF80_068412 [Liparis tanakae]